MAVTLKCNKWGVDGLGLTGLLIKGVAGRVFYFGLDIGIGPAGLKVGLGYK